MSKIKEVMYTCPDCNTEQIEKPCPFCIAESALPKLRKVEVHLLKPCPECRIRNGDKEETYDGGFVCFYCGTEYEKSK